MKRLAITLRGVQHERCFDMPDEQAKHTINTVQSLDTQRLWITMARPVGCAEVTHYRIADISAITVYDITEEEANA